jgi:pyruvate kinase
VKWDGTEVADPTLGEVVEAFIKSGADVIRMNVAHSRIDDVGDDFRNLKREILRAERRLAEDLGPRRIGVLVDLPGPKIRFQQEFVVPTNTLIVKFDPGEEGAAETENGLLQKCDERAVRINLGDVPFAKAVDSTETHRILTEIQRLVNDAAHTKQKPLAFIGDNECTLEITEVDLDTRSVKCRVVHDATRGEAIGDRKGFTIRGVEINIPAFTEEDAEKLSAVLAADVEGAESPGYERVLTHIGLSFCQTGHDVCRAIYFMLGEHYAWTLRESGLTHQSMPPEFVVPALFWLPDIIAKIETRTGLENLEDILDYADGVMIARGDLALQMQTVEVPAAAKQIVDKASRGKTVIMATQMLESMRKNIECSRPEAFDVFNAVVDGVDAVMLSGETSVGRYPEHAIRKMRDLAAHAEGFQAERDPLVSHVDRYAAELTAPIREELRRRWSDIVTIAFTRYGARQCAPGEYFMVSEIFNDKQRRLAEQESTDRITHAACRMAADGQVKGIVAPTKSGRTVRMLARFRPPQWVFAEPHHEYPARKLSMVWGAWVSAVIPNADGMEVDHLMKLSWPYLQELRGQPIIFICGTPIGTVGTTNLLSRTSIPDA